MKFISRFRGTFLVVSTITFAFCNLAIPPSSASDNLTILFKPPTTASSLALDAAFPLTFQISGGIASQSNDCNDINGIYFSLLLSDESGNVARFPQIRYSVEGLWGGYGWTTKVIPSGLECTWNYNGKDFKNLVQATYQNGDWFFTQSQFDYNRTDGSKKASRLILSWSRDPKNYSTLDMINPEGTWSVALKGSVTPEVSFTGLTRGEMISMPKQISVQAIADPGLPISEFQFSSVGSQALWELSTANGQFGVWNRKQASNCEPPKSELLASGRLLFTSVCTYVPRDTMQNKAFRAVAYTSDHRSFVSSEVYVNTQMLQGFKIPKGKISLVKDSKGNAISVAVSGTFTDVPLGVPFQICLIGESPQDPGTNSRECSNSVVNTDSKFSLTFKVPAKFFLTAYIYVSAPLGFDSNISPSARFVEDENPKYEYQNHFKLSPQAGAGSNTSRYADGYKLINQTPATLNAYGFYGYFSANKKMTKSNATRFCQYFVRQQSLRTDYFDGFSSKNMTTFIQGCSAAALKIPYGK